jgi:hypothetical protein
MADDEGLTLSRNDPLQEFLRAQKERGWEGSHDEFMQSYEAHMQTHSEEVGASEQEELSLNVDANSNGGENATVVMATSPVKAGRVGESGGSQQEGDDDSPLKQSRGTPNLKSIVLKFTTLSDACTEAPSFNVGVKGASFGRDASNEVCVPSDAHLVPNGHASLE